MLKNPGVCRFVPAVYVLFFPAMASAQAGTEADPPDRLDEVVVQASKQEQPLDALASSATLIDGGELQEQRMQDIGDLAFKAPGLSFQLTGQSSLQPPVLRGLSASATSFSSSVVLMVDGVPVLSGFGFEDSLLGVEYVEVLRGPQSTLFGRNAQAGVINVVTRKPSDEPHLDMTAELGQRQRRAARMDASGALVPGVLYAGFAGDWTQQDGFIRNTHTQSDENNRKRQSGRLTLRWTPQGSTDVTVRYSRRRHDDGGADWGGVTGPRYVVASGYGSRNKSWAEAASLNIEHSLDNGVKLQSVTTRSQTYDRLWQDTDFLVADLRHQDRNYRLENISQDIRIFANHQGMRWLVGVYADQDNNDLAFHAQTPVGSLTNMAKQKNNAVAVYGNWTIPLWPRWAAELGTRVEHSSARIDIPNEMRHKKDWMRNSPKIALIHQTDAHSSIYWSISSGFRAGGYNAFAPAANSLYDAYSPEKVISYEWGMRKAWPERKARGSLALYYMRIEDMHVQQILGGTSTAYITNAAKARSYGIEITGQYQPATRFSINGNMTYNRTRFQKYHDGAINYSGNRNPFAPDWQGSINMRYETPQWYAQASSVATGKIYMDAANRYSRPGYARIDLSSGWKMDRCTVSVYVNNAAGKRFDAVGFSSGLITIYSPPREWGLRLHYKL